MGGATKLPMLLSTPSLLLRPRPSPVHHPSLPHLSLRSLSCTVSVAVSGAQRRALSSSSLPRHGFLLRAAAGQLHAQTNAGEEDGDPFGSAPGRTVPSHPWPEWVKLVEHVAAGGYVGRRPFSAHGKEEDEDFLALEGLPEEFAKAAGACLLFARERPDLLRLLPKRDVKVAVENGSPFLFKNAATSVGRMNSFIDSDGSNVLGSEQAYTVDMMRYLLSYVCNSLGTKGEDDTKCRELVEASIRSLLCELVKADCAVQEPKAIDSTAGHTSVRYEQSQKPPEQKIAMKRGDWICPKCSFMNFARNTECLECKEARPRRQLTGKEWECPQCDFFNYGRNMACLRCDCKRPEETSSLERRLGSTQHRHSSGSKDAVEASDSTGGTESDKMTESAISRRLDRILGHSPTTSETKDTGNQSVIGEAGVRTVRRFISPERRDPGYVPFVPLPADMFRKKPTEEQQPSVKDDFTSLKVDQQTDAASGDPGTGKSDESSHSEDFNNPTVGKADKESFDPSEQWSRKVAQLPDDNNLPSSMLDDDFPEIMPMRKGENRFVVSKKKDRSLTSPQYKRRIAMEQANNSNFVPFVPFSPGYFAKKDKQPEDGSSTDKSAAGTSASAAAENVQSMPQKAEENKTGENNWGGFGDIKQTESSRSNGKMEGPTQHTDNLWNNDAGKNFSGEASQESTAGVSSLHQQVENPQNKTESGNRVFSGKSLEGSAVTEPDPLDMSEEAKAQRWFRRVAQINDISELSKIPDEDFPEIMPMRKGVNRFVVSKRKTPLERRLTSPQYRRNLPIVSSEPEKESSREYPPKRTSS